MFSIIIPVFNIEKYISRCLESVLPAIEQDDEIILSLGYSNDDSSLICRAYADAHPNVRLLYQDGKGLSNARNCAMRVALGDYIICIDGDDFVDTDAFRSLLTRIRQEIWTEDLIILDYYRLDRRTGRTTDFFQIGKGEDRFGIDALPTMLKKRQCFWNVWRYIYRREFLVGNQIMYLENSFSEDIDYTTKVLLNAESIRFSHSPYYYYTVGRGDSIMDHPTWERLKDTISVLSSSINSLRATNTSVFNAVIAQYQFEFVLNLAQIYEIPKQYRSEAIGSCSKNLSICSPTTDRLISAVMFFIRIFGIKIVAFALHLIKCMRRFLQIALKGRKK